MSHYVEHEQMHIFYSCISMYSTCMSNRVLIYNEFVQSHH